VVEELAKGLALLWLFTWKRQEFDGLLDGLMYGALVGFGFAMTENFFYFIGAFDEGGARQLTMIILLRSLVFGLNHAFYTGLTGIGFGMARNVRSRMGRLLWIVAGLTAAIVVHSIHNLGAALAAVNPTGLGLSILVAVGGAASIVIVVLLAWQQERYCIQTELAGEVDTLITGQEFRALTGRWRQPFLIRRSARASRIQLLVELAQRKRRLRLIGPDQEPKLVEEIAEIRARLLGTAEEAA
jgi:hypothetical protein